MTERRTVRLRAVRTRSLYSRRGGTSACLLQQYKPGFSHRLCRQHAVRQPEDRRAFISVPAHCRNCHRHSGASLLSRCRAAVPGRKALTGSRTGPRARNPSVSHPGCGFLHSDRMRLCAVLFRSSCAPFPPAPRSYAALSRLLRPSGAHLGMRGSCGAAAASHRHTCHRRSRLLVRLLGPRADRILRLRKAVPLPLFQRQAALLRHHRPSDRLLFVSVPIAPLPHPPAARDAGSRLRKP